MKKKVCSIFVVAALLFALCSCGKNDAVAKTEEAINNIGEVTLESIESIEYAEKLYNILSDSEKSKVENRLALAEARDSYDKLVREAEQMAVNAEALVGVWGTIIGDSIYTYYEFTVDGKFISYAGFSEDSIMKMAEGEYSFVDGQLLVDMPNSEDETPSEFSIEGDTLYLNGETWVKVG